MARYQDPNHYFQVSRRPLQALIFLLPLLLLYELGTAKLLSDPTTGDAYVVAAWSLLAYTFDLIGVGGYYLPGLVVIAALLGMHVFRREPWEIDPPLYLAMAAEALAWSIVLLVFAVMWGGRPEVPQNELAEDLILGIGAGVYEELVFRLIAIVALHLLLVDVFGMRDSVGAILAVVVSAALFSGYHFVSLDTAGDPIAFTVPRALFFFLGGLYFGTLFVWRGFGVAAGAHAFYDIIYVLAWHEVLPWSA